MKGKRDDGKKKVQVKRKRTLILYRRECRRKDGNADRKNTSGDGKKKVRMERKRVLSKKERKC